MAYFIRRRKIKTVFVKILYALCFVAILFIVYSQKTLRTHTYIMSNESVYLEMKYILLWTLNKTKPFTSISRGQTHFLNGKCSYINCFITSNRENITNYDVILFSAQELNDVDLSFPVRRLFHQKYMFASKESPNNYAMDSSLNGFFNWTWTYKLDSDVRWGYIVVKDLNNSVIGPRTNMSWLKVEEMYPVENELAIHLRKKRKLAAWIVSKCHSDSLRETFFENLQRELSKVYSKGIDVFGRCSKHVGNIRKWRKLSNQELLAGYYFYLSFEKSLSEDYVTEELLLALQNNVVPVVYGGANYTRFMPNGTYLNAIELGVKKLAAKMVKLMKDPEKYADYFRWQNHYKYERTAKSPDTNEYCKLCKLLNNNNEVNKVSVYWNFTDWWKTNTRLNVLDILDMP